MTTDTRARILAAARDEFAAQGFAGARVDRIATAAQANKERIYAYFDDKAGLYRAVHEEVMAGDDLWPAGETLDLVGTAGALFDAAQERPHVSQLAAWRRLEPDAQPPSPDELAAVEAKLEQIRAAQRDGRIDADWDAADLLAITGALVAAWTNAPAALRIAAERDGRAVRDRRDVIEKALRRIVAT